MGEHEEAAALAAVRSGWVAPLGPEVDGFEADMAEYLGASAGSIAALSSGSAALELAMLLLGVEPGDWVAVPTKTFIASANSVLAVGARPVFLDVDDKTWNLDTEKAIEYLDAQLACRNPPAAVMWVDLYGTCSDFTDLKTWCREHEIPIVEDAAEAVGSRQAGQNAGTLADIGVLSFNGNKIMTTSGGGMLVADPDVADRARWLASQAREPGDSYVHEVRGYNYRLSNICAAIGRAQLRRLPSMIDRRRAVRVKYQDAFVTGHGLRLNPVTSLEETNCWLTVLQLPPNVSPSHIIEKLAAENIEARRSWNPMHLQPLFADSVAVGGGVASAIFDTSVCLPSGSTMTESTVDRVIDIVGTALTDGCNQGE